MYHGTFLVLVVDGEQHCFVDSITEGSQKNRDRKMLLGSPWFRVVCIATLIQLSLRFLSHNFVAV